MKQESSSTLEENSLEKAQTHSRPLGKILLLLPQAQEDLDTIRDPLFTEIIQRLEILKEYPLWGAAMDGPFTGYRSFVVGIFRVVYKAVSNDLIEVAYIRHCKMNLIS